MLPEASSPVLLESIARLFLTCAVGYLAVRLRVLSSGAVESLSRFIITVSLPSLIIATMGRQLHPGILGTMGLGVVAAAALNGTGIAIALVVRRFFIPRREDGRNLFLSLSAIQNSGYLPIPLVVAVLPEHAQAEGLLLTFVYVLVMGFLFWSVGVWLVTEGAAADWRKSIRKVVNPPMVALVFSLLFLAPPVKAAFLAVAALPEALKLIGDTTIPLVMIVLGGSFGGGIPAGGAGRRVVGISAFIKLAITPACALLAIKTLEMEHTFGFILMLQAAMPAAMNHIVVAREYGGNVPLIARTLFVHYALSVISIPFFLSLFDRL